MEILKFSAIFKQPHHPPAPLAIFSSFYPLPVKLKCNVIQQNRSVTIQAMKINQGSQFGKLKKPMLRFIWCDYFLI